MEPPEIERLDERTIQRIAAGEVVERPASVVKELVENSLDAGATRVAVAVESGGIEGIRVRDDGVGIPSDQLEAAVAEHATSKITDITDLDHGVGTLGFRGEALYTIGAVSRLTVRSRPPDADAGAEITVSGGEIGDVTPAGCPTGTTVEVEDLFYNTPARKKFLKRTTTEFDHVNTVVTSYALANPDVAVSLEHDGRETFATEGNGDLRSAVLAVYGREVAESMVDVEWTPDGSGEDTEESPVRRVTGLVSHPETTRASRNYLSTYVNDRYVTASTLREGILDAYGGQLASDRYPFAVLFVEVPPGDVDVNVHPRKLEVRFDEERAVQDAVETAVKRALLDSGLIRSTAPRGRSAPDEATVAPEQPTEEAVGGAGTTNERRSHEDDGDSTDDPADGSVASELAPDDEGAWAIDDLGGEMDDDDSPRPSPRRWQEDPDETDQDSRSSDSMGSGLTGPDDSESTASDASEASEASEASPPKSEVPDTTSRAESRVGLPDDHEDDEDDEDESPVSAPTESGETVESIDTEVEREGRRTTHRSGASTFPGTQRTLSDGETTTERSFDSLPPLRVLGQLHDTYVVASAPDGLVLIDQHAADERVNYERLQQAFADGIDAQALAAPVTVELTAREAALFADFSDDLEMVGFRAERADERSVVVTAVPAVFDATLDPELLRDVLSTFVADAAEGPEPVEDVVDELLADLACYPSVTGNTSLTEGSVVDLLERLDECENPYACPHGRPVVIQLEREEIASRFERDYPGHGGRRAE